MRHKIFLILLVAKFSSVSGQVSPEKYRKIVLQRNQVGKMYSFDFSTKDYCDKMELAYLGNIKTEGQQIFKILSSSWYWGNKSSPRLTSRIVVFDNQNHCLGNYYIDPAALKIEENVLVIHNKDADCNSKLATRVSFDKGIPKRFFVACNGGIGDFYSFGGE